MFPHFILRIKGFTTIPLRVVQSVCSAAIGSRRACSWKGCSRSGFTDSDVATLFAEANVTYQRPAVVLPHSSLVRFTRCLNNGIRLGFRGEEPYHYVKSHWPRYLKSAHLSPRANLEGFAEALKDANDETGFLLISDSLHCDASESGIHSYWHVTSLHFDDQAQTVDARAIEVGVKGAFDDVSPYCLLYDNRYHGLTWLE